MRSDMCTIMNFYKKEIKSIICRLKKMKKTLKTLDQFNECEKQIAMYENCHRLLKCLTFSLTSLDKD